MAEKKKKNKNYILLLVVIAFIVVLIGGSYAWLKLSLDGGKYNIIKAGTLSLRLEEENEIGINEDVAIPVTDKKGLETEGYSFTLENDGKIVSNYTIYLDDVELSNGEERIPDKALKYVLIKNGKSSNPALLNTTGVNPNRKLDLGKLKPGEKNSYTLKVWIDYRADNSIMGKVFSTKLRVVASQEIKGDINPDDKKYDQIVDMNNPDDLKVDIGDKDPNNYTFESSDPEIADIDDQGNIIPKGPGEVTITIRDKETGEEEKKVIKIEKEIIVEFEGEDINPKNTSCKLTEKGQIECTITLPNIDVEEGYEFKGWKEEGSDDIIPGDTKVTVSKPTKFIPIIEKLATVKTVTFNKNGKGIESIGEETKDCSIEGNKCYVTLPKIVAKEGYEVIGWSLNKDITDMTEEERTQILAPGEKIVIEDNTTYYAISKSKEKIYTARFYKNGAISQDGQTDEYIEKSCIIAPVYNNEDEETSCRITSPDVKGSSNTENVLGYSTEASNKETVVNENTEFELTGNKSYYAITTNGKITKTARFIKNGEGVSSIGDSSEIVKTCNIDATYNGEVQNKSCSITPPSITVKDGYTKRGWSQNQNAKEASTDGINGYIPEDTAISITSNDEERYYSISSKNAITYSVNFHLNGAASQDGSTEKILTKSCPIAEVYNDEKQDTTCTIKLPVIVGSENTSTVVGYAENKDATVGIEGTEITVSNISNKDYYAITKKDSAPVYVNYRLNNATSFTLDSEKYTNDLHILACNKPVAWNGEEQKPCKVTLPTIEASTNTPTVIGWSDEENKHEATYESGQANIELNEDITLYAQTKKDEITYKVGSYNVGKNVSNIDSDNSKKSCKISATYNGQKQEESCTINEDDLPIVTAKQGYEYAGWTKESETSTNGESTITLTNENNNKDWYAYAIGNSFKIEYYSNGNKDSEETLQVSNSIPLKVLEKDGYTFKGWSTDSSATTASYNRGENATDLTPSKGDVVKLYAVWVDDIKPVCSWSVAPTTTTQNTAEIKLTCTDEGSGIADSTLTTENFEVSSATYGEITAVSSPKAVENGYEYTLTIKGLSNSTEGNPNDNIPGEFNISLKQNSVRDRSNNGNDSTQSENILVYGRSYTATFTKNGSGVTAIGSTSDSCITKGTNTTCNVTAPTISVSDGYKVVGWNNTNNAVTGVIPGDDITLSDNATYYTIYKKDSKEYTAVFHLNGAESLGDESNDITRSCTIDEVYNDSQIQETSCTVEIPVIKASSNTPTVLGFATKDNETDTNKMINTNNETADLPIDSDIDYYAITRKDSITYQVTYIQNGIGVTSIEKTSAECTIDATYNGVKQATTCSLQTPNIEVATGYEAVGWAKNANEEVESNIVKMNSNINLTDDAIYYSISKRTPVTYTATFNLNGAGTQTKEDNSIVSENVTRTCQTDTTWNNTKPDTDCTITTPELTGSTNTPTVVGYAENKDATIGTINQNQEIELSNNVTYYAITKKDAVTLTANWSANNATLSSTSASICNLGAVYNGATQDTSCTVEAPTITAPTNTPKILGYNTTADANQNNSSYNKETGKLTLTSSNTGNTWYSQTKKDEITYTVSNFKIGLNVTSIDSSASRNCKIEATYNGVKQATSCSITPPSITPKTGYTSAGWNTTHDSTENASSVISINSNVDSYYAHATANTYTIKYWDGTTEVGSTNAKVDDLPVVLKTKSQLNISKTGYTFKGWSTTNGGTVVYTDGQSINSNLATTAEEVVNLYTVWQDDIKPTCTWSGIDAVTTQNTTTATLTCKDEGSKLVQKNLSTTDFTTTPNGQVSAVSNPTAVTNGYQYTVTLKGLSVGTYTVSLNAGVLRDNAGNTNNVSTSANATVNGRTYTATFTMNGGVSALSKTTDSCTTTGSSLTCDVDVPTMTLADGYTEVGWNTSSEGTTTQATTDKKVNLSSDTTYYTITKKPAKTLTANWNANGASLSSGTITTCNIAEVYNSEPQADICMPEEPVPTITRDGFNIVGFNDSGDKEITTAKFASGAKIYLSTSTTDGTTSDGIPTYATNKTWYAITNKVVTITWTGTKEEVTIGATQSSCTIFNNSSTCNVTTPSITGLNGRVVLGWYASDGTKFANPGDSKEVSANATYVAKSRQLEAAEVTYDNSNSGLSCTNAQCAIDEINKKLS